MEYYSLNFIFPVFLNDFHSECPMYAQNEIQGIPDAPVLATLTSLLTS